MIILARLPDPDGRARYVRCGVDRLPSGAERVQAAYWSDGIALPIRGWAYHMIGRHQIMAIIGDRS